MNWINVNDRLPECNELSESEYMLCYDTNTYDTFVAWYNCKKNNWTLGHYTTHNNSVRVDFWQPLPEPPIEDTPNTLTNKNQ